MATLAFAVVMRLMWMSAGQPPLIQKLAMPEEGNGRIHGMVVDSQGVGFSGVGVTITHQVTHTEYSQRTDASGKYDFTNLPSGSYDVLLQAPPTPAPFKRLKILSVEVLAGNVTNLDSRMQISDLISPPEGAVMIAPPSTSGDISGVVLDDRGAGMAGVEVTLVFAPPSSLERKSKTDSDGAYRFIDLAPGKYKDSVKDCPVPMRIDVKVPRESRT